AEPREDSGKFRGLRAIQCRSSGLFRDQREQLGVAHDRRPWAVDLESAQGVREHNDTIDPSRTRALPCRTLVLQRLSHRPRCSRHLSRDIPDGSAFPEPSISITTNHASIVLGLDHDHPARAHQYMVNVAAMARQYDVVDEIEVVGQSAQEGAHEFLAEDTLSVSSGLRVLTSGRGSASQNEYQSDDWMQQESDNQGSDTYGEDDCEQVQKMAATLTGQIGAACSKDLHALGPHHGMLLTRSVLATVVGLHAVKCLAGRAT